MQFSLPTTQGGIASTTQGSSNLANIFSLLNRMKELCQRVQTISSFPREETRGSPRMVVLFRAWIWPWNINLIFQRNSDSGLTASKRMKGLFLTSQKPVLLFTSGLSVVAGDGEEGVGSTPLDLMIFVSTAETFLQTFHYQNSPTGQSNMWKSLQSKIRKGDAWVNVV